MVLIQVTGNMAQVVRGMDRAMESMNPERVPPHPPCSPSLPSTIPYFLRRPTPLHRDLCHRSPR
jgi:hypothetical protein